jgi:hypothetical protein
MAINPNRFNDPALGQAFGNLAAAFAPPSSGDIVNYTTANAKKQEAERLAWLFSNPNDPLADRKATMAGVYLPTQSYYAQDQNNATAQRGQDVTASTSITNNQADNARALDQTRVQGQFGLAEQFMSPLDPGQVQPGLPGTVAGAFGLPELPRTAGNPEIMSETQQKAAERQRLQQSGVFTEEMLLDSILGEQAPVKSMGDSGPVFMSPGEAARTNAPAFVDAGSAPKPENGMAQLADGTQVPAIQDVMTGRWKHAQTGQELPADIRVFKTPAPVGTSEQVGVGKPVANNIDRQLIDVAVAKDTATKLRDMIASSPASQGAVGWLRGTAQNVVQTGGELGQYFGGQIQQVTNAIASGAADASLAGAFDPNIPAIEMMANLLAFQYAKTTTGERLSNEMLRAAKAALGLEGLTANQASSLARIDMAIKQMESQEAILRNIRTNGVGAGQPPAAAAPTTPMGGADAPPDGIDPADWEFMTPEERALFQ